MDKPLQGKKIAILATDDFEEAELTEPKKALEDAGAQTFVIAPHEGEIQAIKHDDKTMKVPVDVMLDTANPDDFDAIMLPGGALNADALRVNKSAQAFVRKIENEKKPIAAICHAPWLLISSELVDNRTLTSYHTIQDDIQNAGGNWQDKEVVKDGNWITSRQPSDIPAFNQNMIQLFSNSYGKIR